MLACDTETFLITPESLPPGLVCVSHYDPQSSGVVGNDDRGEQLALIKQIFDSESVWHNAAYDLVVIATEYPVAMPWICKALAEGRVHDTKIREKLRNLATYGDLRFSPSGKPIYYGLAELAFEGPGIDIRQTKEGDDIWRLRYSELDGWNADHYPPEAYEYARMDAEVTYKVWEDQENRCHPRIYKAASLHVQADFCLFLMTCAGLLVDQEAKEELQRQTVEALDPRNLPLIYQSGIVTPAQPPRPYKRGAKDHAFSCVKKKGCSCPPKMAAAKPEKVNVSAVLKPLVEQICEENGIEVETTPKGATSTAKDFLSTLAAFSPPLAQFSQRQKLSKLVTSYFPALEWPYGSGQTAHSVHPDYDVLKKTGRVSSRGNTKQTKNPLYPRVAIQVADPRVRGVYMPRPGHLYAVVDYTALELCSLAQTVNDLFGYSNLKDQINEGVDPHAFLGNALAFHGDPEWAGQIRGMADMDAYALFLRQKTERPDWFKRWRTLAKPVGLGYPGGLGTKTMVKLCASYGMKVTEQEAKEFKQIWFDVYPVMRRYLNQWVRDAGERYVTPMGMIRAKCSYTELANGNALQSPAAEGAKKAMWLVTRACYDKSLEDVLLGCRPVIFLHDEIVTEVPRDNAFRCADRVSELMIQGMNEVLPDVRIRADPEVHERWIKGGKPLEPQTV